MLIERLRDRARRHPGAQAIVYGEERTSYEALYHAALALAGRLRALGVREGDFVCVLLPNSTEFVAAFFAVAALRGVAVTMDPVLPAAEQVRRLDGLVPTVIVTDSSLEANVPTDCPKLLVDCPDEAQAIEPGPSFEGPVLCQFSTGSTGLSKRVVRTQRHLAAESRHLSAVVAPAGDAVAAVVPMHHAHGFGNALLLAIDNGLSLIIPRPPLDADGREVPLRFWRSELLSFLAAEGVTILPAVPFVFDILAGTSGTVADPPLRLCISAGSGITGDTWQRFFDRFGVPIRQLYGCTEAGSVTFNSSRDMARDWQSVGRPLPGVELRLEGDDGEVAFRSGALCKGYHGCDGAEDAPFQDGWFRPGDLGRFDDDGMLYILGRKRSFISTGGYKVDPREVEQVLLSHQEVAEAVVFGVPHPVLEEIVKAVAVPRPGASVSDRDLAALCRERLAPHKRPRELEVRDKLPRSALGKVLVRQLL